MGQDDLLGWQSGKSWAGLSKLWSGAIKYPNTMNYNWWSEVELVEWSDYFESGVLPNSPYISLTSRARSRLSSRGVPRRHKGIKKIAGAGAHIVHQFYFLLHYI